MPNLQLSSKCTVLKSPAGPARPGCTVPCLRIAPSSMHTLPTTILQAGGSMTLPCLHDAEVVCAAKADVRSLLLLLRRLRPAANHTGRAGLDEVACNTRDGSASVASQSVHLELTATARSTAWCRRRLLNAARERERVVNALTGRIDGAKTEPGIQLRFGYACSVTRQSFTAALCAVLNWEATFDVRYSGNTFS